MVFCPPGCKEFQGSDAVSGYQSTRASVLGQEDEGTDLHLWGNTGIVVAYDVNEAVALTRVTTRASGLDMACNCADG